MLAREASSKKRIKWWQPGHPVASLIELTPCNEHDDAYVMKSPALLHKCHRRREAADGLLAAEGDYCRRFHRGQTRKLARKRGALLCRTASSRNLEMARPLGNVDCRVATCDGCRSISFAHEMRRVYAVPFRRYRKRNNENAVAWRGDGIGAHHWP